jgi:hypothetical protein
MDAIGTGFREASDTITGTLLGDMSARALPNEGARKPVQRDLSNETRPPDFLARIQIARWHQTPTREGLLLCGKIAVCFADLGLTIRACDFVLHLDGRPRVNLPKRQFLTEDGPVIGFCASFNSHEIRRAFSDAVWTLLRFNNPELEAFAR